MSQSISQYIGLDRLNRLENDYERECATLVVLDMLLSEKSAEERNDTALLSSALELVKGSTTALRKQIAHRVSVSQNAPIELCAQLALDDFAVAEIILRQKADLSDDLMIDVVQIKPLAYARTIAQRPELSRAVIAKLVSLDNQEILTSLIEQDDFFEKLTEKIAPTNTPFANLIPVRPAIEECNIKTASALFWAARPKARLDIFAALARRKQRDILLPLFSEHAAEALENLLIFGTAKDLWRSLFAFINAHSITAANIQSEPTALALGAMCKLIGLDGSLFGEIALKLKRHAGFSYQELGQILPHYEVLSAANACTLLRALDETLAPWAEHGYEIPNKQSLRRPTANAISGFKNAPRRPVALSSIKTLALPAPLSEADIKKGWV